MSNVSQWVSLLVGFSVVLGFAAPIVRKIGEVIGQIVVVLQSHQNLVDKVSSLAGDLQKLTSLFNELLQQLEKTGVITPNESSSALTNAIRQEASNQITKWS